MSPSAFDPVVVETRLPVPPDRVFTYFTQADRLTRWLGADIVSEAVPGGRFQSRLGRETFIDGRFMEIEPSEKLTFTWGRVDDPEVPPASSLVELSLHPDQDEGTSLRLVHRDLPLEYRQEHLDFWNHQLGQLAALLTESRHATE